MNPASMVSSETAQRMRLMNVRSALRTPRAGPCVDYSDEWYTPDSIPSCLGPFALDPCAGPKHHAVENWKTGGLDREWRGRVWLNPPYSNVHEWLAKMIQHKHGIALVNARSETQWFQNTVASAKAVLVLRRRVNFERPDGKRSHSPCGSVLIAFADEDVSALLKSKLPGIVMSVRRTIKGTSS